jgi:DHA3 family macrolide efflux protein-like MFS transporter
MNTQAPARGMRIFTLIWAGQLVSLLGLGLSGFALGLWVLRGTGSVTRFALISMFTVLPRILLAPVAGALTDRWDRRRTMMVSESVSAVATLALASLLYTGHLQIWQIYVAMSLISTSSAFQWPAYTAAATVLVPKEKLGQASGMVQSAQGVAQTCAPMLAGFLIEMPWVQVGGVLVIDALSYLFALGTLLAVRFPSVRNESTKQTTNSLLQEIGYGCRYLVARPGLLGLLFFLAAANFVFGLITVLVAPLVLSFASPKILGTVMTSAGMGMMIGSIAMAAWGGPKRRVPAILGFTVLSGIALLPAGIPASATVIAIGAFFFLLGIPFISGCSQAIMQSKVGLHVQGRVFAITGAIGASAMPLAYLAAGPLADRIFEPALARGGPLAATIGSLIGVGPGRGIALAFMTLGVVLVLVALLGVAFARFRNVESELPDAIVEVREVEACAVAQALVN